MPEYETWEQVAGYFDGDGTIGFSDLSNLPFKIGISLVFVEQSIDQLNTVKDFLRRHGIRTSNILRRHKLSAYILAVSEFDSVKTMLRGLMPFLCKKAVEARAALDYCENRITGNELVAVFRREVEAGRRERRPHRVVIDFPYAREQGVALMKEKRIVLLRDAFGRYRSTVTPEDFESIRDDYFSKGKQLKDLTRGYPRYSKETIRRVLGKDRGYVGVKGIGRVDTTDTTLKEPRRAPPD